MKHPGRLIAVAVGGSIAAVCQWRVASQRRSGVDWRPPRPRTMLSPLAARVIGDGPPIVLLHGLGASGVYWGSAYDRLSDGHRLVVPDLLGFGESPRPSVGYGPDEHVAAIEACLDAAHVQQPAVVVAHSAGGIVALRLAATCRERVRAVIMFGPPLYPDSGDARRHVKQLGLMARLFANDGAFAAMICRWSCAHRRLAAVLAELSLPDLPSQIARDGVEHSWASYSETLERLVIDNAAADWLSHVTVPVVIVAGLGDPVCNHPFLQEIARSHQTVDYRAWPGGHHLPLTDPTRAMALIVDIADGAATSAQPSTYASS
ncbi:MAG: alpha/beta fold hydrolase [Ilumatobacteraceae bacterium]